jgi:hypothetical protein
MQLTEEDFNEKLTEAIDTIVSAMAETPEIDPDKFFSMVCMLENLQFFSPVIYGALKKSSKE